jgi:threonine synthase
MFVTHLESALDGTRLAADRPQTVHDGRPLWVRYDLPAVARSATREAWRERPAGMWRYRELLPPEASDAIVTLGESPTPLLRCDALGASYGLDQLWIKDESRLPTGSFKSRGLAMAVTMARKFGIRRVALPTAGNAGGAAAAYAARAGIACDVFMPRDTPAVNQYECHLHGARVWLVDGLITDCGRIVREGQPRCGWFDLSTLREPYRIEGKKTMGLELADQFDWRLPDVIVYPTGGGTGLIGMWKAFDELAALGWLADARRPRMVAVQSDGCCPIVRAWESGNRFAEPFPNAATIASGIRVPAAIGDFMILQAVHESGGRAVAVPERRIGDWMHAAARRTGIAVCPETAACLGAVEMLAGEGWIGRHERVVVFNTAAAQKYPEAIAAELPQLDPHAVDWDQIAAGHQTHSKPNDAPL